MVIFRDGKVYELTADEKLAAFEEVKAELREQEQKRTPSYLNIGVYCVSLNNTKELRKIKDFCKTDMVKRIFDTIRIDNTQ